MLNGLCNTIWNSWWNLPVTPHFPNKISSSFPASVNLLPNHLSQRPGNLPRILLIWGHPVALAFYRIFQIHPFLFMLASPVLIWNLIRSGLDCYKSLLSGLDTFHLDPLPSAPAQLRSKIHTITSEVFLKGDSGISFLKRKIHSNFPLLNKLTQDTLWGLLALHIPASDLLQHPSLPAMPHTSWFSDAQPLGYPHYFTLSCLCSCPFLVLN